MKVKMLLIYCSVAAALQAQLPAINPRGVVNAASLLASGVPAGSIAEGSIFSVFGSTLGPATGVHASSFPLGTSLSGVSITVTQGATTVNALPVYVQQSQINAIMPSNAPLGWVSLRVIYNNAFSNPSPVYVVHDSPGIFSATGSGGGEAAVQNVGSSGIGPQNSNQLTAKLGQTAQLYLTGLGPNETYLGSILPALILCGLGFGLIFAPAIATATLGVDEDEAGIASAMVNTSQQVGGSIGVALLSTISASAISSKLADLSSKPNAADVLAAICGFGLLRSQARPPAPGVAPAAEPETEPA